MYEDAREVGAPGLSGSSPGAAFHEAMPQGEAEVKPWWKTCLTFSPFSFASSELERLYEKYLADSPSLWTWVHSLHILMGWIMLIQKYVTASKEIQDLLPPVWFLGLIHPLNAAALLYLLLFKPGVHAKHRQAIYAGIMLTFIFTFRAARVVVLWMRLVNNKAGIQSWVQQLQTFFVENLYFALIWMIVLAYPLNQVPAVILTTLYMLAEMAGNSYICSLPVWGESSVTMSPRVLAWSQAASSWISGLVQPYLEISDARTALSCPAALSLWQLVGWCFACHVIFAADIMRRRGVSPHPCRACAVGSRPGGRRGTLALWAQRQASKYCCHVHCNNTSRPAPIWSVILEAHGGAMGHKAEP
eukprot:jgi/Botrbrau1/6129/Bobra.331_2s0024.1